MTSKQSGCMRKGKATEQLIAAICVLATSGELNALTALVDDEGVDLTFKRRDGTRMLDVQVKARFSDRAGSKAIRKLGCFMADVYEVSFRPREDLYMLYLVINGPRADIDTSWLVPSEALAASGMRVTIHGRPHVRFQASVKPDSHDKWAAYRYSRKALPQKLLAVVTSLEPGSGGIER
jgi:hypothetical protein